jgi:ATP-binding cassette, subfamily B, bacterial
MDRLLNIFRLMWRADRRTLLIVLVLTPITALGTILASYALKLIIDAVAAKDWNLAVWAVVLAAICVGLVPVLQHIQHILQRLISDKLSVDVERDVLQAISAIPGVEYAERPEHLNRLNLILDQGKDLSASVWSFSDIVILALRLIFSSALLAFVHPVLALLPAMAIPVLAFSWLARKSIVAIEQRASECKRRSQTLTDLFLFHASAMELKMLNGGAQEAAGLRLRAALKSSVLISLGWIVYGLGFAGALYLAATTYLKGESTLGDFVMIWQLSLASLFYVQFIISRLQELFRSLEIFNHLDWLNAYAKNEREAWDGNSNVAAPTSLQYGVSLSDVGFTYPGTSEAVLNGVSLHLKPGSITALVGENGAGKTTLSKLLLGHYRPTQGSIQLDGVPLDSINSRHWQISTSATHQDYGRIEALLRQSVGIGAPDKMQNDVVLQKAIESAAAMDFTEPLREGLEARVGKRYRGGVEPSGGQWQRLAIARSFMPERPLVFVLDEPTNAIDPLRETELLQRYASAAQRIKAYGGVMIVVSHRFSVVRMVDKIVVMDKGKVLEQGSHAALMAAKGTYARLFTEQAKAFEVA